jgi:hypothetical protein
MLDTPPALVIDDPWLEPYTHQIQQRMQRCDSRLAEIRNPAYRASLVGTIGADPELV